MSFFLFYNIYNFFIHHDTCFVYYNNVITTKIICHQQSQIIIIDNKIFFTYILISSVLSSYLKQLNSLTLIRLDKVLHITNHACLLKFSNFFWSNIQYNHSNSWVPIKWIKFLLQICGNERTIFGMVNYLPPILTNF